MKVIIYIPASPKDSTHVVAKEPMMFYLGSSTHVRKIELTSEEELTFYKSLLEK